MKSKLARCLLLVALLVPLMGGDCEIDDDFNEDGGLTEAIYATGDAVSQIIIVSEAVWGQYIPEP